MDSFFSRAELSCFLLAIVNRGSSLIHWRNNVHRARATLGQRALGTEKRNKNHQSYHRTKHSWTTGQATYNHLLQGTYYIDGLFIHSFILRSTSLMHKRVIVSGACPHDSSNLTYSVSNITYSVSTPRGTR